MDAKFAEHLKGGARVVVTFGSIVADIYGTPPIVTTATVMKTPDPADEDKVPVVDEHGFLWLAVDIAQGQTLPQRYNIKEVVGFLMPMATVTHDANGTTWGTLPADYVGP